MITEFLMINTDEVLHYWFGDLDNTSILAMDVKECMKWHSKSPDVDKEIKQRFESDFIEQIEGFKQPLTSGRDYLAYILLFDQFARNMYRDTAKMYSGDEVALHLCHKALNNNLDDELPLIYRLFLYMPLMHSENVEDHLIMLDKFKFLMEASKTIAPNGEEFFKMAYQFYAVRHHEIIDRFGRYPHRNNILGRESTKEEIEFLKEDNSSF
jgi:uncharacterized protein (DUF924 family)